MGPFRDSPIRGIEAAEGSVNIRLYPNRWEADEAHRKGVMMLYTILFPAGAEISEKKLLPFPET